jgi:nicotinate-nucleotide pyrophosphorylase (carboxylating)
MERYYTKPIDSIEPSDFTELVRLALSEDRIDYDITSESIFKHTDSCKAKLISKQDGILAGLCVISEIQKQIGNQFQFKTFKKDGESLSRGDLILELEGNLITILRVERPLLNFLQYLSGISTETNSIVKKYENKLHILDTRKTLPAYRKLAKYAVFIGGGFNHRINLSDMALIKDNHVALSGSIESAVLKIRNKFPDRKIELEIDTLEQLDKAIVSYPDIILLDNFSVEDTKIAYKKIKSSNKNILIECSGGITPEKLNSLSEIGEMGVSMGYLTHTTRFLDLSLEIL